MRMILFWFTVLLAGVLFAAPCMAQTLEIRLGIVTTPGSAQYICAEKFKELVENRGNGDVLVKIYHSGSLGTETEILQQIQMNALQMGIITLGPFDVFVPEVKVVGFPFLFPDYASVDKVLDGEVGRKVLRSLERAGFKGLAFSENGFRNVTNGKRPIQCADDVRGLKIRVMESELHKELWRILGANPTPMGWPVYTELQQGTIDGQENPLSVIAVYKLYEVQPFLSLTGHVYSAHISVANLQWFEKLSRERRQLLLEAARDAAVYQRRWNRENEAAFLTQLKEKGMQVVEHPDVESFREKTHVLRQSPLFMDPSVRELLDACFESAQSH